jgi:hypothetical protein
MPKPPSEGKYQTVRGVNPAQTSFQPAMEKLARMAS